MQTRRRSSLLFVLVYIGCFIWEAKTVIPYIHPTLYTNFWWGLIHGTFIVPNFIWSLIHQHGVTIYQFPNDGNWYNCGYALGSIGALTAVARAAF